MKQFINGNGELHFQGVFLSPRVVKEALEKKFRLITIEESSHHVRYKIIRFFRLYGGPAIFPQARIDITIRKNNSHSSLYWHFIWPEYYVFLVSFIILFAVVVLDGGIERIPFLIFAFIFTGFIVFADTKWVSRRVRKTFKEFQDTSHNKSLQRMAYSHR
jgi:hypothetical protein